MQGRGGYAYTLQYTLFTHLLATTILTSTRLNHVISLSHRTCCGRKYTLRWVALRSFVDNLVIFVLFNLCEKHLENTVEAV